MWLAWCILIFLPVQLAVSQFNWPPCHSLTKKKTVWKSMIFLTIENNRPYIHSDLSIMSETGQHLQILKGSFPPLPPGYWDSTYRSWTECGNMNLPSLPFLSTVHCPLYRLSLFTRYLGWLIDCCCVVMPSWQDFDITEQHSLKAMWLRVRALEDQEHTDCNIIRNLCSSSPCSLSGVQQASDSCAQCCLQAHCPTNASEANLHLENCVVFVEICLGIGFASWELEARWSLPDIVVWCNSLWLWSVSACTTIVL